jgi:phosphate starvation-inducible protein PhoH and related proteins
MQQPARKTRKEKAQAGTQRVIKEKFMEQREEAAKAKPLLPMNDKQRKYIELLNEKPIVVATGYAGTSKTYVPTVMAADLYKLGQINKIIITRPAVSTSKSVGYTSGDFSTKMAMWLGSVIPILKERLGAAMLEIAIDSNDIEFQPLETVKGLSLNNTWLLVEESSDLTKDEVIKIVTRMGKNSKLVLSGDIRQSELKGDSGLVWLTKFIERHNMQDTFGHIDFNDINDIVRSDAVRKFIVNLVRDEKRGIN